MSVFSDFHAIDTAGFSEKFTKRHGEAAAKVGDFEAKLAADPVASKAVKALHGKVESTQAAITTLGEKPDTTTLATAMTEHDAAKTKLSEYLAGEGEHGGKKISEELKTLHADAEKATSPILKTLDSKLHGRFSATGFTATLKHNATEAKNAFTSAGKGARTIGFGRVAAVGVGAGFVIHGIAKSENKDGDKRSALARGVEVIAGGALMAGGALAGATR